MKFASKSIVSTVVALSMMMFASVTAYAADYGSSEGYPEKNPVETEGSTHENPAEVITDSTIEIAVENTEEGGTAIIYADNDNAMLTEDGMATIAAAKDQGIDVSIERDDSTVGTYSTTFSNFTGFQSLDLTTNFAKSNKEQKVETKNGDEVSIPANALVITPKASGSYGVDVTMTFNTSVIDGMDPSKVNLNHVSDDGKVTEQNDSLEISDNTVSITINHASFYVLTDQEMAIDDDDDVSIDNSVDAGIVSGDDANPGTGVALAVIPAAFAAAAAVAAFKKKK